MSGIGVANITKNNQVVECACGGCKDRDIMKVYQCACRLTRETEQTHSIVELCDRCQQNMATLMEYKNGVIYKICGACKSYPPEA